jgi:FAD/FMN-containing dehydrogenase
MLAQWTEAARTDEQRSWARAACDSLHGFSEGAHLPGAIDAEPQEVVDSAFGANLPRLAAIKARYDPDNFFRLNQNIRPAIAESAAA